MIDYKLLADAIDYYAEMQYPLISVPWAVSKKALQITQPEHLDSERSRLPMLDKYLVASAEQSFLEMAMMGILPLGGGVSALTPCFRDEPVLDKLHQSYFMKLELFILAPSLDIADKYLNRMVNAAQSFFVTRGSPDCDLVPTSDAQSVISIDIELNGAELGSYGIRQHHDDKHDLIWVYGTGLAEPRFSTVLKEFKNGSN